MPSKDASNGELITRATAKTRLIQVTEGNIRQGHLYLTGHLGFFPADCFGAASERDGAGRMLTLHVAGLKDPIQTDIPRDAKTGQPRRFFRRREWVKQFFRANKIRPGAMIILRKTDRFELRIEPAEDNGETHVQVAAKRTGPLVSAHDLRESLLKKYAPPKHAPHAERNGPRNGDPEHMRSIDRVDWKSFRFIDLFAGIGGIRLGFESVGGQCVFTSEWDQEAQVTYEANFGDRPHGDITEIRPKRIPDHDVLLAGFPCQPFSIIGDRKGFADTRGTLFFKVQEILAEKRPVAILLENVRQFKTHDNGRTFATVVKSLSDLGYFTHTVVLNALHYGVPQLRQRTFIVGFLADLPYQFPRPVAKIADLGKALEADEAIPEFLWASERIQMKRLQRVREQGQEPFYPSMWHENKGGFIGVHPFSCALRHNASHNYLLVNGRRRPSPRECLRLQGFPDKFKIVVPYRPIRAQAGNSVAVPVIAAIARQMIATLTSQFEPRGNGIAIRDRGKMNDGECLDPRSSRPPHAQVAAEPHCQPDGTDRPASRGIGYGLEKIEIGRLPAQSNIAPGSDECTRPNAGRTS